MSNDPNLQAALDQLVKLWIYLQRPVLSRQIIALLAVVVLAWLIANFKSGVPWEMFNGHESKREVVDEVAA